MALLVLAFLVWDARRDREAPRARQRPVPEEAEGRLRGRGDYRTEARSLPRPRPRRSVPWDKQRLWSGHVDWEPAVAVDPAGRRVYQFATRYYASDCSDCPEPVMVFRHSEDGGATWSPDRYPFRRGRGHNDARLAVDGTGAVHAAWLQDFVPGVMYARSGDGGLTWSDPVALSADGASGWSDHPFLLVSRDGRDVYVAFNSGDSWIVASHDRGATFGAPLRTNDDERYWFHTGGAIGPDGALFVVATDYSQNYRGDVHVNVLRSGDGGRSWSAVRVDTLAETPGCSGVDGCYLGFFGPRASIAVDPGGTYLLVYNGGRRPRAPQRLWVQRSDDGVVWRARRGLKRPSGAVNQTFPLVAAAGGAGEFSIAWLDDRRGAGSHWNTYVRRTRDGGRSWERAVRVSVGGPHMGYRDGRGFGFPYGDYFGLAVDDAGVHHLIWGAGESHRGNGGVWYTRGR